MLWCKIEGFFKVFYINGSRSNSSEGQVKINKRSSEIIKTHHTLKTSQHKLYRFPVVLVIEKSLTALALSDITKCMSDRLQWK